LISRLNLRQVVVARPRPVGGMWPVAVPAPPKVVHARVRAYIRQAALVIGHFERELQPETRRLAVVARQPGGVYGRLVMSKQPKPLRR
jgi:hypothetical protein